MADLITAILNMVSTWTLMNVVAGDDLDLDDDDDDLE